MRKVISLLILLISTLPALAQTTVTLDDTTVVTTNERLGLNISSQNYYDSARNMKEILFRNPGFEARMDAQILQVSATGTTTSFTSNNQYDPAGLNFWAGASFRVAVGSNLGCTGTIASNTLANADTDTPITYTLSSACLNAFAAGDEVVVRQESFPSSDAEVSQGYFGWWNYSSGGGVYHADGVPADQPPGTLGKQVLKLDSTAGSGASAGVVEYINTIRTDGNFYLFNGTYTFSLKAKLVSGSGVLTVSGGRDGGFQFSQNVTATGSWQTLTGTFTANETSSAPAGNFNFRISSAGSSVVLIDDASLTLNGETNPTPWRDAVVSLLTTYHPGACRYWAGQNGESLANWLTPVMGRERANGSQHSYPTTNDADEDIGLEEELTLFQQLGCSSVEIVMPVTFTPAEATGLVDFLAGDSTVAYGAKRIALGHSAAWTSIFPVYVEVANETWNTSASGEDLPYGGGTNNWPYIPFFKSMSQALRASAFFNSNIKVVAGVQASFWADLLLTQDKGFVDAIAMNGYTGGGTTNTDGTNIWISKYAEAFANVTDSSENCNFKQVADLSLNADDGVPVYVYEYGDSSVSSACGAPYANTSLTQSQANGVADGEGQAIMDALQPLLGMQYYPNKTLGWDLFTFDGGYVTKINGSNPNVFLKEWSAIVDSGGTFNTVRPIFLGNAIVNQAMMGPMTKATLTSAPTLNFTGFNDVKANSALPLLYAFPFKDGSGNRSLILFNTDTTAAHSFIFAGTNVPTGSVKQVLLTSPNLTDNNETGSVVAPVTTQLASFSPSTPYIVPAHSMVVLSYSASGGGTPSSGCFSITGGTVTGSFTVTCH